ncbi:nucleotidyl transferase family protein, partial [Nocardia farcinica]
STGTAVTSHQRKWRPPTTLNNQPSQRRGCHTDRSPDSPGRFTNLKGPNRPLVPQAQRAAMLTAFSFVDAVLVFDEDTPAALLERLRPHVWVKGGDYGATELPETAVVQRHGGQVVVGPYLEGVSTSELIERAVAGRVMQP